MRVINIVIFLGLVTMVIVGCMPCRNGNRIWEEVRQKIRHNIYVVIVLLITNLLSFAMTFASEKTEIYVEKGGYGEEEQEIPFLLQKGENAQEISLTVSARQLSEEELKVRIQETFHYLAENMKGENPSLSEVRTNLNFTLDQVQYPFEAEFVSTDYALIDREGNIKNEKAELLALGYTEEEVEKGIATEIEVTLWYGEESFEKTYPVIVFQKSKTPLEEQFQYVIDTLSETEKKAKYEDGFVVPMNIDGVEINRTDEKKITPGNVLLTGVILAVLLMLREKENKKKELEIRKSNLIRSYPWFVNEMVLLLGAGMQVRNIFHTLIQEYESRMSDKDYRNPLISELKVTIRAMELGMSEEQAYYRLGRRLGIPCYIKIMTLLEQNVKRGGRGLTDAFEQEETVALEERKNLAKRYGEEAGTKLLGPMILLLLVVMLMIMVPALWSFS